MILRFSIHTGFSYIDSLKICAVKAIYRIILSRTADIQSNSFLCFGKAVARSCLYIGKDRIVINRNAGAVFITGHIICTVIKVSLYTKRSKRIAVQLRS